MDIRGSHRSPKTLPYDRADVSQHVIEEPSGTAVDESDRTDVLQGGMEEQEGAIRNNKLTIALIEGQKMSEVSWCLLCSERESDVAVGIQ